MSSRPPTPSAAVWQGRTAWAKTGHAPSPHGYASAAFAHPTMSAIMATLFATILSSLLALLLWTPVGWLIARWLPLERDLRLAAAPILGWAVQNIVVLHIAMFGGFTTVNVL